VLREGVGFVLRGALRQVGRVGPARQALHRLSVVSRGCAVVFLRVRRLVPDNARGAAHVDRRRGVALVPAELDRALQAAQQTLKFVHLGEALARLRQGTRLRDTLAVLTFDESFAATAELALPVCRARGVPATFFVTTGALDEPDAATLWDSHVHAVVAQMGGRALSTNFVDRPLPTATASERASSARRLLLSMTSLDEGELGRRLHELDGLVGGPPAVAPLDRLLQAGELTRLCRDPLVAIGAHGRAHLALSSASDAALFDELEQPRARLRELCGGAFVDVVSYPFGRPPYVDDRVVRAARAAGYQGAFTALPGVARPGDHLFQLPRLPLDRGASAVEAYELAGTLAAVDELLLAAWGDREHLIDPDG
jgi:peptidoglycan/xylan/chitin deacetylase (PgdA/CDA1 family)